MKKGRFLWSAHRITEKQKAGKAENIKENSSKTRAIRPQSRSSRSPVQQEIMTIYQKSLYSSGFRLFTGSFTFYRNENKTKTNKKPTASTRWYCYNGIV